MLGLLAVFTPLAVPLTLTSATPAAVQSRTQTLQEYWEETVEAVFGTTLTNAMPTLQLTTEISGSNWLKYHKGQDDEGNKFGLELALFYQYENELESLTQAQRDAIQSVGMTCAIVVGVLHAHDDSEVPFHGIYFSLLADGGVRVNHIVPLGEVPTDTISALTEANSINASATRIMTQPCSRAGTHTGRRWLRVLSPIRNAVFGSAEPCRTYNGFRLRQYTLVN